MKIYRIFYTNEEHHGLGIDVEHTVKYVAGENSRVAESAVLAAEKNAPHGDEFSYEEITVEGLQTFIGVNVGTINM